MFLSILPSISRFFLISLFPSLQHSWSVSIVCSPNKAREREEIKRAWKLGFRGVGAVYKQQMCRFGFVGLYLGLVYIYCSLKLIIYPHLMLLLQAVLLILSLIEGG